MALNTFLFLYINSYILLIGFLCYAALFPIWSKLTLPWKVVFSPVIIFLVADFIIRCTIGWVIFLEMPTTKSLTITALCNSHVLDVEGASYKDYKRNIARTICKTLNMIQPRHCPCLTSI